MRDRYGYMAAVLEQSILRGWEGLFALKDDFVDTVPYPAPRQHGRPPAGDRAGHRHHLIFCEAL